jgi:hypothetical protein
MTCEYAAQPRKSDSGQHSALSPKRSDPVTHVSPPTAPVLYRGRFHRGRVPYWCGTIANGPPTPPQWCGTLPHGRSVSFTSLRPIPRATRAIHPSRLRRFHLPPRGARRHSVGVLCHGAHVPSVPVHLFVLGEVSGSPLPPAYRHRSRLWVDQSTYGLRVRGPELPGLNRVPHERPDPRPTGSPGSGTRIRDLAYGAPDVANLALPFSQPTVS